MLFYFCPSIGTLLRSATAPEEKQQNKRTQKGPKDENQTIMDGITNAQITSSAIASENRNPETGNLFSQCNAAAVSHHNKATFLSHIRRMKTEKEENSKSEIL